MYNGKTFTKASVEVKKNPMRLFFHAWSYFLIGLFGFMVLNILFVRKLSWTVTLLLLAIGATVIAVADELRERKLDKDAVLRGLRRDAEERAAHKFLSRGTP